MTDHTYTNGIAWKPSEIRELTGKLCVLKRPEGVYEVGHEGAFSDFPHHTAPAGTVCYVSGPTTDRYYIEVIELDSGMPLDWQHREDFEATFRLTGQQLPKVSAALKWPLKPLSEAAGSEGQGLAALKTWCLIQALGEPLARHMTARATWYRHRLILTTAGLLERPERASATPAPTDTRADTTGRVHAC